MKMSANRWFARLLATGAAALLSLGLGTSASAEGLEEIVVTAQKTEQNVQDVPIAITAFTAASLQAKGITDVAKLSNFSPNVTLDAGTPFSGSDTVLSAFIRGIGQNDFAFNQDPGVGVYVDGVFLARSVGSNTNMLDVDRVEILKGPQGTLFGRNTVGGAISIVTRTPGDKFMARGEITGGSYDRLDARGTADIPITDQLLTTVSFSRVYRQGYQKRIPFPGSVAGSSGIPDCDAGLAAGTPCPVVEDSYTTQPAAGYHTSNREGGLDQWSFRGKVVFLANDDLTFTVTGDYTKIDQPATANTPIAIDTSAASNGLGFLANLCLLGAPLGQLCTQPRLGLAGVPTPFPAIPALNAVNVDGNPNNNRLPYDSRFITGNIDTTYSTGNSFSKLDNYGVAGIIDYDINESMHLKSITAYRNMVWDVGMDLDGSPLNFLQTSFHMPQHEFSQELQLTGTTFGNRLDYVAGLYYFKEKGHLHDYVTFPNVILMIDGPNDLNTEAYAGFGHLDIHLTDDLTLIAGGRLTVEHKQFEGHQTDDNGLSYKISGCFPPGASSAVIGGPAALNCQQLLGFPNPGEPYRYYPAGTKDLRFTDFSPTLGAQYQINDNMMAYVTYSRGYKTGSWTTRLSNPHPTYDDSLHFDPETATTEEIGLKSELFDRRVRMNVAVFHTDYKNIQLNSQIGISPTLVNAGDARMYGFEIESEAQWDNGFSLTGGLGWIDAKYTRINPGVGDNGIFIDTSYDLPKTPEWKFAVSPQYVMAMPGSFGGELQFNLDYTYTSGLSNDLGNTALLNRPGIDMLGVSGTYRLPGDHWEVTVGGTNLLDERYIVTGQNQGGVAEIYGTYSEPSQWYATLRASY